MKGLLILFFLNFVIAVFYAIWQKTKKNVNNIEIMAKTMVLILCPGAGILFLLTAYVIFRYIIKRDVDLEDVVFRKDRVKTFLRADEERGRTMVPMEEALVITDKTNLRNLMLNVVRADTRNSLASIAKALDSEDSETSHYAASVLQDELNGFRAMVQNVYNEILKEKKDQLVHVRLLIEYMNPVLSQRVFTDMEQKDMVLRMASVCQILYDKERLKDAIQLAMEFRGKDKNTQILQKASDKSLEFYVDYGKRNLAGSMLYLRSKGDVQMVNLMTGEEKIVG